MRKKQSHKEGVGREGEKVKCQPKAKITLRPIRPSLLLDPINRQETQVKLEVGFPHLHSSGWALQGVFLHERPSGSST